MIFYTTHSTIAIKKGNMNGKANFDMQKSEYVPILSTFNSRSSLFQQPTVYLSEQDALNIATNRYLNVISSSYYSATSGPENYFNVKKGFIHLVSLLSEGKCYYDKEVFYDRMAMYRGNGYKRFPYDRAFSGSSFKIEDYTFSGISKTMLISGLEEDGNLSQQTNYLFTFKTKYLEELMRTLIQGKPVKANWFTVFMTPSIPVVTGAKGYSKAFKERFVYPFEEKGVEIIYTDNIIEQLSFTDVPPVEAPYEFKLKSKSRKAVAEELEQLIISFKDTKLAQIEEQEAWDLGKRSLQYFEQWGISMKSDLILRIFSDYIDKLYYSVILPEEGMKRQLMVAGEDHYQIFKDGEWAYQMNGASENFAMSFEAFSNKSMGQMSDAYYTMFEEENIALNCMVSGTTMSYSEQDTVVSFSFGFFGRIKNYKSETISFADETPSSIKMSSGNQYVYDPNIRTYNDGIDIVKLEQSNIISAGHMYVTTFSEYNNNPDLIPSLEGMTKIYFWDLKVLCIKLRGLLLGIRNQDHAGLENGVFQDLRGNYTFISTGIYDGNPIMSMLRDLDYKFLLTGQSEQMGSYYGFTNQNSNISPEPPRPVVEERGSDTATPMSDGMQEFREVISRDEADEGESIMAEAETGAELEEIEAERVMEAEADEFHAEQVQEAHDSARAEDAALDRADETMPPDMPPEPAVEAASDEPDVSIFDES